MKKLLKSKDLLKEERVIAAARGLLEDNHFALMIVGEAQLAFWMRDACMNIDINPRLSECDWYHNLVGLTGHLAVYHVCLATPKQWIIAATLTWEKSYK